jgi:hypothetical protein
MIQADEVPEYAGLIYLNKETDGHHLYYGLTLEVKKAARIHSDKLADAQKAQLHRALTLRYWRQRLNNGHVHRYECEEK